MSGISLTLVLQNHNASYPDMAAKVQTKLEKLTARAGIFCAESYFRGFQLDKLINEVLGVRSKAHNGFQWDEVILPLFDTYEQRAEKLIGILEEMVSENVAQNLNK